MVEKFSDYKKVFDVDISQLIYQILLMPDVQQDIIEFNQSQLTDGVDSNEERIITISAEEQNQGEVYSIFTIAERKANNLQTDNVDLNFTGQFWSTFTVKVTKTTFEVIANFNSPGEDIRDNFDDKFDFLGLTNDSLENFTWLVIYEKLKILLPLELKENTRNL
jgi:hypothetical protein